MAGRRTPGLTTPAPGGRRAKASAVVRVTRRPSHQAARLLVIFITFYADSARCSRTSFLRPGKTLAYVSLDCVNHSENGQKLPNLIRGGPAARRRSARSAAWGRRAAGWPAGSQVARDTGRASVGRSRLPPAPGRRACGGPHPSVERPACRVAGRPAAGSRCVPLTGRASRAPASAGAWIVPAAPSGSTAGGPDARRVRGCGRGRRDAGGLIVTRPDASSAPSPRVRLMQLNRGERPKRTPPIDAPGGPPSTFWPFSPRFTRLGDVSLSVSPGRGKPTHEFPAKSA